MNLDDTIVAIATPAGRGGIGIVRIAGPRAREIASPMLRLKRDLEPGRAIFGEIIEPRGAGSLAREGSEATTVHVGTAAPGCPAEQSSAQAADKPTTEIKVRIRIGSYQDMALAIS